MGEANAQAKGDSLERSAATDVGSDAFYRAMTELSPQIAWMATPQGEITFANEHWFRYTGLSREQTYGAGWVEAIDPAHLERIVLAWNGFIESGDSWSIEAPYRRASDATYRWHLCRGVPMRDMRAPSPAGWALAWTSTTKSIWRGSGRRS